MDAKPRISLISSPSKELALGGREGQDLDFDGLYRKFGPSIRRLAAKHIIDSHLAEDVMQETFLRVHRYQGKLDPRRPLWPWLASIVRNTCVDVLSRARLTTEDLHPAVEEEGCWPRPASSEPEDWCMTSERDRLILDALASLNPRHQRLLTLKHGEGWRYKDIASLEGTTVDALQSALKRARQSFRAAYAARAKERGLSEKPFTRRKDGSVIGGFLVPGFFTEAFVRLRLKIRQINERISQFLNDSGATFSTHAGMLGGRIDAALAVGVTIAIGLGGVASTTASPSSEIPITMAASPARQMIAGQHRVATPKYALASPLPPSDAIGVVEHQAEELGLNPAKEETPEDTYMSALLVSPNYEEDHTLYASGIGSLHQSVLFVSQDGGATWTQLPAAGFLGGGDWPILVSGSSGIRRVFNASLPGLQESIDGGRTFLTKVPFTGLEIDTIQAIAPSPAFETDRRLILFTAAAGTSGAGVVDYWSDSGLINPTKLNLPPGGSTLVGVSPAYTAEPIIFVSNRSDLYQCKLSWCEKTGWDWTVGELPLSATFSPKFSEDGIVFVSGYRGYGAESQIPLFVSTDGAKTFRELDLSKNISLMTAMTVLPAERGEPATAIAATPEGIYRSTDNGDTWTIVDSNGSEILYNNYWRWAPEKMIATPAGRLFALLRTTGLACSENRGLTWAPRCPTEL